MQAHGSFCPGPSAVSPIAFLTASSYSVSLTATACHALAWLRSHAKLAHAHPIGVLRFNVHACACQTTCSCAHKRSVLFPILSPFQSKHSPIKFLLVLIHEQSTTHPALFRHKGCTPRPRDLPNSHPLQTQASTQHTAAARHAT